MAARPFDEAWIDSKGTVFSNGVSHFDIAQKRIREIEPTIWEINPGAEYESDWYDFCYQWMWSHGYGRLRGRWNGNITIQTCSKFPDFRANLLRKAKSYCKKTEGITALECDKTGRTLWSKEDTL